MKIIEESHGVQLKYQTVKLLFIPSKSHLFDADVLRMFCRKVFPQFNIGFVTYVS